MKPLRVFIVEDEALVSMLLEDVVTDLGHQVVATASSLQRGLELATTGEIDLAILDVNLGGPRSYPIAEILRGRGIPFFFVTGYGSAVHSDEYRRSSLTVRKPFTGEHIAGAFGSVLALG